MGNFEKKVSELDQKARIQQNKEQDAKEKEELERLRKNDNFYMIYKTKKSSQKMRALIKESPVAAQLFMFLAEQADRGNAVVASGQALATFLQVSPATISRALKVLTKETDEGAFLQVLRSGGTNIFVLNPDVIWSAWRTGKEYCLFGDARVLISTDEQDPLIKKKIAMLINGGEIRELPE